MYTSPTLNLFYSYPLRPPPNPTLLIVLKCLSILGLVSRPASHMWPVANGQSIAAHRPSGTAEASQRKSSSYAFSSGAMHWEDVRAARRVVTI
jgi:hypothetical protein